jgi:regulator of replication initiation timing
MPQVVKENEFLLSDGNALHDDLKKLVTELEKMQDKYRKVVEENKQLTEQRDNLQREQSAVTIAGKVSVRWGRGTRKAMGVGVEGRKM